LSVGKRLREPLKSYIPQPYQVVYLRNVRYAVAADHEAGRLRIIIVD
jgi:hypothetical protein